MEHQEYERMLKAEDWHWWYIGMQAITRAMLDRFSRHATDLRILDAGCGTGAAISTLLEDYGNVIGFDISPLAIAGCKTRNLKPLALASVMQIPFPTDYFDLLTSFDVLYENSVTCDSAALTEFFRVVRPGGIILLRLPAYNWLRGQHDITIHTARRYNTHQLSQLLKDSGFRILQITYANTFLFPLAAGKRLLERCWPPAPDSSDLSVDVGAFNSLFKLLLSSEAFFATNFGLPFGLSVIALGQKPIDA